MFILFDVSGVVLNWLMMVEFTNQEFAEMHLIYGLADGNCYEARRLYAQRYPNRILPDPRTFANVHNRLCENGSFKKSTHLVGANRTVRTPEVEEAVLNVVENDPATSTRKIAATLNISHVLVWKILMDNLMYPYHIQRVQALLPRDFPLRFNFCQWFLQMLAQNQFFENKILFSDEANFSRNAITNFHNNHFWAEENPHSIRENNFQEQFSVNVWAGIIGDYLIGPFFLPARLNGQYYRQFLEEELPGLLEEVPIFVRNQMWFMHDGAPPHFSIQVRNFLNQIFNNRWIGRGGPVPWPPRSPDLNSLDFFFWGHLKALVYQTPVQTEEDLRNRIVASCDIIRDTPGIFGRVRQSMRRRLDSCILARGGHFQQFL